MMKSRIDSALDIRSVHEAGHAIAAVRNRVAFSYVSIERDLLPGTGGHIMVTAALNPNVYTAKSNPFAFKSILSGPDNAKLFQSTSK
jgi:hypothetical protein